jgi:hypothetical protein
MSDPTNTPPTGEPRPLAPPPAPSTYQAPSMPDLTDLVEGSKGRTEPTPSGGISRGLIVGGVVGALVIAGGAFFAGKATAAGPATLADAITAAQKGTLPCGESSGTGGGAFLVQRLCQSGTGGTGGTGGAGGGTTGGQGAGGFGGRGVVGSVTAVSASSITVNTRAGSVTVAVPGSVKVQKTVDGSMADVKIGEDVTVASTTDSSGNRTASTITIVPAGSAIPGFGGNGQPGGTPPSGGPA